MPAFVFEHHAPTTFGDAGRRDAQSNRVKGSVQRYDGRFGFEGYRRRGSAEVEGDLYGRRVVETARGEAKLHGSALGEERRLDAKRTQRVRVDHVFVGSDMWLVGARGERFGAAPRRRERAWRVPGLVVEHDRDVAVGDGRADIVS